MFFGKRFRKPDFQKKLGRARRYQRKKNSDAKPRSNLWLYAGLAAVFVLAYFLYFSEILLIQKVTLTTAGPPGDLIEDSLRKMGSERSFFIPANHIVMLTPSSLLESLKKDFPEIRKITEFQRIPPDGLKLGLEEREPRYIWETGEEFFLLDQDGVVFQRIANYDPKTYSQLLITDRTGAAVKAGEDLGIQGKLGFLNILLENWPNEEAGAKLSAVSFPGRESLDLFTRTDIGFGVYFDLKRAPLVQLEALKLILLEEIDPQTYSGLSYIDLRLSDIAYYCYKDAPCSPEYQEKLRLQQETEANEL